MSRTCRRNGCHEPATASLTFRYDTAEVRLDDLESEPHPQRWELCERHAGVNVPRGWGFLDARSSAPGSAAGELAAVPERPVDAPAITATRPRDPRRDRRDAVRRTAAAAASASSPDAEGARSAPASAGEPGPQPQRVAASAERPSASAERPGAPGEGTAEPAPSRYAALRAELPRVAAEYAAASPVHLRPHRGGAAG
ncbi:MAG: DUF3499 family protein [Actinomycetota bacterium]